MKSSRRKPQPTAQPLDAYAADQLRADRWRAQAPLQRQESDAALLRQALEAMTYSNLDVSKFNRINAACAAIRAHRALEGD